MLPGQDILKTLFNDPDTSEALNVTAVSAPDSIFSIRTNTTSQINSINWARILGQIVYYFHSYFSLKADRSFKIGDKVRYSVPSGNFGDSKSSHVVRVDQPLTFGGSTRGLLRVPHGAVRIWTFLVVLYLTDH